jgi:hypothetical protein
MNYTKSGIIACGAPNSAIRSRNEAQNAFDTIPQALLLTEEGIEIANRFLQTLGSDPKSFPIEGKAYALNDPKLFHFLAGYLLAANKH